MKLTDSDLNKASGRSPCQSQILTVSCRHVCNFGPESTAYTRSQVPRNVIFPRCLYCKRALRKELRESILTQKLSGHLKAPLMRVNREPEK